jgi:anti-anti-sigma regulatory factor
VLNVKREQQGGTLVLHLSGEVNEAVDFNQALGTTEPDTLLNCKEVTRVNSVGVKGWVKFFQERVKQGTKLRFVECSPAIVEQLNIIMNFACGGRVESVYVPFVCTSPTCRKSLVGLFKTDDLKRLNFNLPSVKCSKCGSEALFDDLPEEYFRFATRS